MYLTSGEEKLLNGELGPTYQKAIEILAALGDIYGADRLIPIKSAQIAGVSYKTIGDAGLEWISDLKGKVVVPSILNPAGMDMECWQEMGISQEFADKQKEIIKAYDALGVKTECSCTPYNIFDDLASFGDHIAWSESSAISYANSVIGARTNREGGPGALSAALIGKTPNYGFHLDENRSPNIFIEVEANLQGSDYGALGYIVGEMVGDKVPFFRLGSTPSKDELRSLGAAMAASGAVALYHVQDVTPEAVKYEAPDEKLTIEEKQIKEVYSTGEPDIIAFGCPHSSVSELEELARLLDGKKVTKEVWICTSRAIKNKNPELIKLIKKSGAKVFCDTCMVVSPASERFKCMMINSGKAHKYVPNLCGIKSIMATTEECVRAAISN
ncbi:MAG: aconitase X catalytic domain-containing protein [Candidatus Methanoperedens sp.]|nr:aconitase X catalytic domain-containing protein [Candidatus Methanoperedens sp.]MCE8424439.1 aconitase X catalytic domain-containing protein [Candidatus Methanoperedens sp.]MCE8427010.1 aconitase X catalytic domain-containing protein [Candidatus Methanoperedens sp.]